MGNTIRINIPVTSTGQAEMYIADLSEINFHAFQEDNNVLSAFIREEYIDKETFDAILSKTAANYTKAVIADINWNQKWEDEFTPVIIDSFVAVRAPFHQPVNAVEHEIIIMPKMSFGTGHHATTFLMMQEMEKINFSNKKVLDFGTGTGVLAILAKKAGANKVTAVDNDDWSIENAQENFIMNNCDNIFLLKGDSIFDLGKFDIILANINLNVITLNMPHLRQACHAETEVLLSGFLLSDEEVIKNSLLAHQFKCNRIVQKEGWICSSLSVLKN